MNQSLRWLWSEKISKTILLTSQALLVLSLTTEILYWIYGGWILYSCAAKAIFYCPSMNSHRPRSKNTAKERALIPEKDSKRKRPRSHVSLENSSKNYKPLEKWAKPNLLPDVTPQPANFSGKYFLADLPRGGVRSARIICRFFLLLKMAKTGERAGWIAVWSSS